MNSAQGALFGVLALCGAGWGLTVPLNKIAVSTGYGHFGLIFWQLVIGAAFLSLIIRLRGKSLAITWPQAAFCVVIALTGTVLPNAASYYAAARLPAGVMALVIALVPMFAFPVALLMRNEPFAMLRMFGLLFGAAAVALLIGPAASLPDPAMALFIPIALIAPFFYGIEGNVVAKLGTRGLDPIQLLCAASWIGALIALPLALGSGQFIDPRPPWGAPDRALMATALIHATVYSAYVWLVSRAGAVFAAQVAYLVTGFGIAWSITLLGERYSGYIWAALALLFAGLFLVQPRKDAEKS
ncbi:MAG: DMT family transporter [Pseudomonadota bacterium]